MAGLLWGNRVLKVDDGVVGAVLRDLAPAFDLCRQARARSEVDWGIEYGQTALDGLYGQDDWQWGKLGDFLCVAALEAVKFGRHGEAIEYLHDAVVLGQSLPAMRSGDADNEPERLGAFHEGSHRGAELLSGGARPPDAVGDAGDDHGIAEGHRRRASGAGAGGRTVSTVTDGVDASDSPSEIGGRFQSASAV